MSKLVYTPIVTISSAPSIEVPAYIDIVEAIRLTPGVPHEELFDYETGIPPSKLFGLEWYVDPPPAPNEQYTDDPRQQIRSRLDIIEQIRMAQQLGITLPTTVVQFDQDSLTVQGLPTWEISPRVPSPESGEKRGTIRFFPPEDMPYTVLYPKLLILGQEGIAVQTKIIKNTPVEEPLDPNEKRGSKSLIPKWDR